MSINAAINTLQNLGQFSTNPNWDIVEISAPNTVKTLEALRDGNVVSSMQLQTLVATLMYTCDDALLNTVVNAVVNPEKPITLVQEKCEEGYLTGDVYTK